MNTRRHKLLVVACGGTISASRAGTGSGASPTMSAEQLVAEVPELEEFAAVEASTFSILPSPHMTIDEVLRLLGFVESRIADDPSI